MARMTASAVYSASCVRTTFTGPDSSTAVTSSGTSSAPNRSAWVRRLAISSGPMTPSGKPGKFSTSVVFISAPPYWLPSNTRGARSARAEYSAAV